MSSTFVPNKRRVKFNLYLRILDLNNVPLVSGTSFIKWHLPSSTAAEHRGRTNKCAIRDHRVAYDYEKEVVVRLTVGKDGMLQECMIDFEILQEYSAGGRGERIKLGDVSLNLAEYVGASDASQQSPTSPGGAGETPGAGNNDDGGVVRRYLMQDSKINSTLKIGIHMRYVEGTRDYYAPPLRTAPVFGGIAGIISHEQPAAAANLGVNTNGDQDEQEQPINLSSTNREIGEMQDMYRRTLAAFWASQPGELKADEAIEDIFAGGDGWGKNGRPEITDPREVRHDVFRDNSNAGGDNGSGEGGSSSRPGSGTTTPNLEAEPQGLAPHHHHRPKNGGRGGHGHHHDGRAPMRMRGIGRHKREKSARSLRHGEVDEFDIRDDLKSWNVGQRAYG